MCYLVPLRLVDWAFLSIFRFSYLIFPWVAPWEYVGSRFLVETVAVWFLNPDVWISLTVCYLNRFFRWVWSTKVSVPWNWVNSLFGPGWFSYYLGCARLLFATSRHSHRYILPLSFFYVRVGKFMQNCSVFKFNFFEKKKKNCFYFFCLNSQIRWVVCRSIIYIYCSQVWFITKVSHHNLSCYTWPYVSNFGALFDIRPLCVRLLFGVF